VTSLIFINTCVTRGCHYSRTILLPKLSTLLLHKTDHRWIFNVHYDIVLIYILGESVFCVAVHVVTNCVSLASHTYHFLSNNVFLARINTSFSLSFLVRPLSTNSM